MNSSKSNLIIALCISVPIISFVTYIFYQKHIHDKKNIKSSDDKNHSEVNLSKKPSFSKTLVLLDKSDSDNDMDISSPINKHSLISLGIEQPLVIVMVGLPARGKSYIVKMTIRYLKWIGFESKVFNVGSHRRNIGNAGANANFFNGNNKEGQKIREEMAMAVQDMMYSWLHEVKNIKRRIAVFDATNTTILRRQKLAERARKENVFLLFVESICDDQTVRYSFVYIL